MGNPEAFNELQRRALTASEGSSAAALTQAFHQLACEGEFDDVGDFHIECRSDKDGFIYTPQSGVSFWPVKSVTGPTWTPIGAGSAAEGGYSWVVLAPRESGVGAIGIYFQQGRLGCLAFPRCSDTLIRFPDIELSDFIGDVRRRYGFTLWGLPALAL